MLRKQHIDGHVSEVLSEEEADYGKAMELASKTSVQVKASSLMGSGNIYKITDDKIVIVTALHIFGDGEDTGVVVFDDGSSTGSFSDSYSAIDTSNNVEMAIDDNSASIGGEIEAEAGIIKKDTDKDICFLEVTLDGGIAGKSIKTVAGESVDLDSLGIKSICTISEVYFGDPVFVYDPYEKAMSAGSVASNSMFIEEFGMDMIYCLCNVSEGMSGSGLFTTRGYYAGMLLGGSSDSEAVCVDVATIDEVYGQ